MTRKQLWFAAGVALAAGVVSVSMFTAHQSTSNQKPLRAQVLAAPQIADEAIAAEVRRSNAAVTNLLVRNVGGIVILRGEGLPEDGERAVAAVKNLGFTRVANLIQVTTYDDESLRRAAERQLAQTRSLDGCFLKVSCSRGVIRVEGTVQNESQQDVARRVLKGVSGAQGIEVALAKV